MKASFITLFLLLGLSLTAEVFEGKVIKITDGDTVHVLQINHSKEKIRLAGIDAPERKQPYGKKSTQYLASMISNKTVTVEYNKRDRYGRIVGKILLNGDDINLKMVQAGYAWHYKKYQREQIPDDRFSYAIAENNARKHKIGLFKSVSVPPWEWRKNKRNLRNLKPKTKQQVQTLLSNVSVSNIKVWVNSKSGKYHCLDTRY